MNYFIGVFFFYLSLTTEIDSERTNLSPFTKGYRGSVSSSMSFPINEFVDGDSFESPQKK